MRTFPRATHALAAVALAFVCVGLGGCGEAPPPTHPVQGKVVLQSGDVDKLANIAAVELELESNPKVHAHGVVQNGGTFTIGALHEGRSVGGTVEGKYKARIFLTGEDDENAQVKRLFHPRYYEYRTSGLVVEVPPKGEVVLTLKKS